MPVTIKDKKGDNVGNDDEEYKKVMYEKIPGLKPVFQKDGEFLGDGSVLFIEFQILLMREVIAAPVA
ncbi:hypothetical protein BC936DRAFT_144615 [Jimgerdemannia flammicorona]|uniref:Uncharacterized protein n=1 Tax=Jimgerdemannia flammicorona TaxID=994334 RepID=A0A433DC46_9FUNG|nr:hypothetical protein BC936DRAFT_144615 [Jimgerdemannia flammicorona]